MARKPKLELVASNEPAPLAAPEGVPQQVEMPFAVVNGEPVTELPKDLYIPPQALEVFLEAFEGPLDLLLYLIRRQNLDILDIPLAEITRQYMKYIEVMQDLQLELAGEYMVMAATLAEIKSRMLLPRPKLDGEGSEEDPRAELVRRLQEYERFKRAAEDVDNLPRLERDNWVASAELKDRKVVRLLPQVTLQEMLVAFKEVVVRSEMFSHHHVARERLSVRERMSTILTSLERASFVEFVHLFRPEEGRMGVTVTFIAILELMREGLIEIVQAEPYAPIHLRSSAEKRHLRLVANNETPEQVAHAAQAGDTVLEEVAAERTEAEARSLADDVGFVDDDEVAEEPIEDFGLDDIKVPMVDLRAKGFPRRAATTEAADVVDEVGLPVDTDESEADEGDAAAGGIATAELTTDEAAAAGEIATAAPTIDEVAAAGEIAMAGPTIGAAGAEGEIAPTGLTIDEAAADATGGQARAAAVGDDDIAGATTGEARVAEASAPRAPFDDDGIDDAGIVDLDELDDEDKSPPDEGRS